MAKEKEVMEVKEETVEVTEERTYVSTKDAFRSIGHNAVEYVKNPETYKRAGKRIAKLALAAAIGFGISKGYDALTKSDEEDWTNDDLVDAEDFVVTDLGSDETDVTDNEETEE